MACWEPAENLYVESFKQRLKNIIRVLADSKLNTISNHISRGLADDKISDEEFRLILLIHTIR